MNKKSRIFRLLIVIILMFLILNTALKVSAEELKENEKRDIRVTFYTDYGTTKSGTITKSGTAAMNDYYLGATIVLYKIHDSGYKELVGCYEVEDTGSNEELKKGNRVDIYIPTEKEGWEFVKRYGDNMWLEVYFDCVG